jgi:hypothetical protein
MRGMFLDNNQGFRNYRFGNCMVIASPELPQFLCPSIDIYRLCKFCVSCSELGAKFY